MVFKWATAFFLLLAFLAQSFSRYIIIADYYLNTEAYIQKCVNKKKPCMHCNGKCQLMKKMQQGESNDQQNPERKTDNKNEIALSSKSFFPVLSPGKEDEVSQSFPNLSSGKSIDRRYDIFHPPQA